MGRSHRRSDLPLTCHAHPHLAFVIQLMQCAYMSAQGGAVIPLPDDDQAGDEDGHGIRGQGVPRRA